MRVDPGPIVDGAVAGLGPLERDDVDPWFAYLCAPQVLEQASWVVTDRSELAGIVEPLDSDAPDWPIRFPIVEAGSLIDTIGFRPISAAHRTAEFAYDLRPRSAGRGIATAWCRAVTEWALGERTFHRVQATALDTKSASQRVLEKCGFVREGRLANPEAVRGEPRDSFLFAKTTSGAR